MSQIIDQPPPAHSDRPSILALVRQDLEEREQIGRQRYGTPLQAFNGRDALVDLYQELLDAAAYIRQLIEENASTSNLLQALSDCVAEAEQLNWGSYLLSAGSMNRAVAILNTHGVKTQPGCKQSVR